jgi:hypothetical protein
MSGSLTNRLVLAAKIEDVPGTLDTGVYSAANAKHQLIDARMAFDFPTFDRRIKRETLTPVPGLSGRRDATLTFSIEEAGHSSSTEPTWSKFMKACGYRVETLYKVTIGAVTGGPFRHGETITQTGTSATAKVFMDTYTGTTTLYVYDVVGSENNSGVWTGGTSGATATPSTDANTAAGFGWRPVDFDTVTVTYSGNDPAVGEVVTGGTSGAIGVIETISTGGSGGTAKIRVRNAKIYSSGETLTASATSGMGTASAIAQEDMPTLTCALYEDGKRKTAIGMRGTFTLSARVGEPVTMGFEFRGAFGAIADTSQLTGITYEDEIPPTMLGASVELRTEGTAGSYAARFSAITLNANNTLASRDDASASSGVREYMIVGRSGSGSIDPEADLEASYPAITNFKDNKVGALKFTVGSTLGNQFVHQVPGLRTTGVTVGDRNGIRTEELAFQMTGGSMANVGDSPNARNDLLIAYITA